jgi:hypothetical protein
MNTKCINCQSERLAHVTAKCSDMCSISLGSVEQSDYVPDDMGIGGGDYIEIVLCLDCGQLQGKFPLPPTGMEEDIPDAELLEFFDECFRTGEKFSEINRNRRDRIISSSREVCARLGAFVSKIFRFYSCNTTITIPGPDKLVEMYRKDSYELDE